MARLYDTTVNPPIFMTTVLFGFFSPNYKNVAKSHSISFFKPEIAIYKLHT